MLAHSDKVAAAGTYKGAFGFYPLLGYVDHGPDATGEPIAGLLRSGNAGSNTVDDHVDLIDALLAALPVDAEQVPMLVRCDSAGASHGFVDALHEAGIGFSVGFPCDERVRAAVLALPAQAWRNAATQSGQRRDGAQVAELHDLDLAGWPPGSRVIARRERPHPGAQLTFTVADGWRLQTFITDQPDATSSSSNDATAPTRASRTASATPRTPAWATCRSPTGNATRCGSSWSCSPRRCSHGCNDSPCTASWVGA